MVTKFQILCVAVSCKNVLKFIPRNGNSNLPKHQFTRLHANNNGSNNILNFVSARNVVSPENLKNDLTDSCVGFIVRDIRPMYATKRLGLAHLLSIFSLVGLKFGYLTLAQCSE